MYVVIGSIHITVDSLMTMLLKKNPKGDVCLYFTYTPKESRAGSPAQAFCEVLAQLSEPGDADVSELDAAFQVNFTHVVQPSAKDPESGNPAEAPVLVVL